MESIECRCVLVQPDSHSVLAVPSAGGYWLPRIRIPRATRPAQQIQSAIKARWGLNIFVLEIWLAADGSGCSAVAERILPERASSFTEVPVEQLMTSELSQEQYRDLELLFMGNTKSRLSQLGWIDEAITWMTCATGRAFSSRKRIEQWNAGGAFVLLRVCSDDGRHYWLKATGAPNAHELSITQFLAGLCPDIVPSLIAVRKEWNAWLTEDAGVPLSEAPNAIDLVAAARRMAQLQILTIGHTDKLLAAGAFDQRLPALRSHIDAVIAYLIDAMAQQTSTKVAPLSRNRLLELGEVLRVACFRLEAFGAPDALIHNDLNAGNILSDGTRYVFTDWSEAAVGNPFLSCERLCQLNRAHADQVRSVYRDFWSHRLSAQSVDEAFVLTRLVAIYAYLYGRGDWPKCSTGVDLRFDSYARSLARHMDRAAKDPSFLEVLCHS